MVLESILTSSEARKHPLFMIFFAILVNSIGLWTAFYSFPSSASVISIAFLTIAFVPLIHSTILMEETQEAEHKHKGLSKIFFVRHMTVLQMYGWFFIGLIMSYAFWFAVMPKETQQLVFSEQINTLSGIGELKKNVTGLFAPQIKVCKQNAFCWMEIVFFNNIKVLALAILFSFLYGAGAVFLISWQASVIGTLIGMETIKLASAQAQAAGLGILPFYVIGVGSGLLGLAPHGIPEAAGYFIGAIAGGIISAAVSKQHFSLQEVSVILKDAAILIAISLTLLLIGAWVEATAIVQTLGR